MIFLFFLQKLWKKLVTFSKDQSHLLLSSFSHPTHTLVQNKPAFFLDLKMCKVLKKNITLPNNPRPVPKIRARRWVNSSLLFIFEKKVPFFFKPTFSRFNEKFEKSEKDTLESSETYENIWNTARISISNQSNTPMFPPKNSMQHNLIDIMILECIHAFIYTLICFPLVHTTPTFVLVNSTCKGSLAPG